MLRFCTLTSSYLLTVIDRPSNIEALEVTVHTRFDHDRTVHDGYDQHLPSPQSVAAQDVESRQPAGPYRFTAELYYSTSDVWEKRKKGKYKVYVE